MNSSSKFVYACILTITVSMSVSAQTFLFQDIPKEETQIGLRFMRPTFDRDSELSTLSGIYDFSLNFPVNNNWNISVSLPYLTFATGDRDADNGIGNIYVGLQSINNIDVQKSSIVSFGLHLPTAVDEIGAFGFFTHFEEVHKYSPDVLTIYGNFAYFNVFPEGARLGLEIGPNIMVPTKGDNSDIELLLHYGLTAGFQGSSFALMTEFLGLVMLTESFREESDRFEYSINIGASYISRYVSPGIFYKIYLKEDLSSYVSGVLGINIDVTLD